VRSGDLTLGEGLTRLSKIEYYVSLVEMNTSSPKDCQPTEAHLKKMVARWIHRSGIQYCFEEFQFIRRPDLIAFNPEQGDVSLFNVFLRVPFDFLSAYHTRRHFTPESIAYQFGRELKTLKRDLDRLTNWGYLAKSDHGFRVIKTTPILSRLITVECKTKDWRGGFEQALSYKKLFAPKSYLALPLEAAKRADRDPFLANGIGLLGATSEGDVTCLVPAKDTVASLYLHSASASIMRSFFSKGLKQLQPSA